MNIAICDDDAIASHVIAIAANKVFKKSNIDYVLDIFIDSVEMLQKCREKYYDLIILDIDMPQITGFEISKYLRDNNISTEIIFISSRDNFVFQSIQHKPFSFVKKDINDALFIETLEAFIVHYMKKNVIFDLQCENCSVQLPLNRIIFFESYNHIIIVHIKDGDSYTLNRKYSLKYLEDTFFKHGFIRIHKSYLVNHRYIKLIKDTDVMMYDNTMLPSTKGRIADVKRFYSKFTLEVI